MAEGESYAMYYFFGALFLVLIIAVIASLPKEEKPKKPKNNMSTEDQLALLEELDKYTDEAKEIEEENALATDTPETTVVKVDVSGLAVQTIRSRSNPELCMQCSLHVRSGATRCTPDKCSSPNSYGKWFYKPIPNGKFLLVNNSYKGGNRYCLSQSMLLRPCEEENPTLHWSRQDGVLGWEMLKNQNGSCVEYNKDTGNFVPAACEQYKGSQNFQLDVTKPPPNVSRISFGREGSRCMGLRNDGTYYATNCQSNNPEIYWNLKDGKKKPTGDKTYTILTNHGNSRCVDFNTAEVSSTDCTDIQTGTSNEKPIYKKVCKGEKVTDYPLVSRTNCSDTSDLRINWDIRPGGDLISEIATPVQSRYISSACIEYINGKFDRSPDGCRSENTNQRMEML